MFFSLCISGSNKILETINVLLKSIETRSFHRKLKMLLKCAFTSYLVIYLIVIINARVMKDITFEDGSYCNKTTG